MRGTQTRCSSSRGGGGLSYDLKILLEDTLGRVFSELRLEYTSKELRRWRVHVEKRSPGNFKVLGLILSLDTEGRLPTRIPAKRWRSILTVNILQ